MNFPFKAPAARFRVLEAYAIGVWALAAYISAALVTWSADDPVWIQAFSGEEVRNLMGTLGTFVGDSLLLVFGHAVWLIPIVLVYIGVHLIRLESSSFDWLRIGRMAAAWLVLLIATSGLAELSLLPDGTLRSGAGGLLGRLLAMQFAVVAGVMGSALVLLVVAGIALQFVFNFSWLHVCAVLGRTIQRGIELAYEYAARYWHKLRAEVAKSLTQPSASAAKRTRKRTMPDMSDEPILAPVEAPAGRTQKPRIRKTDPSKPVPVQGSLIEADSLEELPPLDALDQVQPDDGIDYDDESLQTLSALLESKLREFGIDAKVKNVVQGPVITRYELELAPGIKSITLRNLQRDLARSLAVQSVRVVDVIEGKTYVGIELPNQKREVIRLRTLLSSSAFKKHKSPLLMALGKDTKGETRVADIADMPHLLMAGTTGSGKSVAINAMLLSILYRATPAQVRLILIDPKMVELSVYQNIPHLLTPVITEMPDTVRALRWCTGEMDRRYKLMNALGVRSLAAFNERMKKLDPTQLREAGADEDQTPLPSILLVIDEFADMMAAVRKQVEEPIARLSAKARAAGIHLVLATQRPSKDVITGLIKANVATRISFQVSQKVDSMVVLDQIGAEQLLGRGDMLFRYRGQNAERLHGAFVTDDEVARVVQDWCRRGEPQYLAEVTEPYDEPDDETAAPIEAAEGEDEHYAAAVELVRETRRASISLVQRQFRIGYNRAANIMEAMQRAGVVSPPAHDNTREVLDAQSPARDS
ncbi:MAG: DNA translocase FtsK 4TM domain-containing protein [Gammaproteobacteria bacterium]|nr:DNA translocase FtsK 4TM domain-containing protein [Gammaproteobacteria bacterium]